MRKIKDIRGQTFGRLTALEPLNERKGGHVVWRCQCSCGNTVNVAAGHLHTGNTQSCGCQKAENQPKSVTRHSGYKSRLYNVWHGIKTRCTNPNAVNYKDYGGRGITICDEWINDFQAFHDWAISQGYREDAPRGECTLDRIDPDGNYCPDNCQWVDMKTQAQNKRPRQSKKK